MVSGNLAPESARRTPTLAFESRKKLARPLPASHGIDTHRAA
jgi:hypothetical protein